MKKQMLNLGKILNKSDQKEINGGTMFASCADLYAGFFGCRRYVIPRCRQYCEQ
jgi:hypothetical protein